MERCAVERNAGLGESLRAPLFVPGDRPDRARKAVERGAVAVILDLEDAVPPEQKSAARSLVVQTLGDADRSVPHLVRINPASSPALFAADLAALRKVFHLVDALILPKVESAGELKRLDDALSDLAPGLSTPVPVIATIETAVGVREAWHIAAASPSIETLLFGTVDLSADLGVTATPDGLELLAARSTVVLACAAAGIGKPIDGPHLHLSDPEGLLASSRHARSLGFGGKICVHPDQLPIVAQAFSPTEDEVQWARSVVETFDQALAEGRGVVRSADGTFIDAPVAAQAQNILRAAGHGTPSGRQGGGLP